VTRQLLNEKAAAKSRQMKTLAWVMTVAALVGSAGVVARFLPPRQHHAVLSFASVGVVAGAAVAVALSAIMHISISKFEQKLSLLESQLRRIPNPSRTPVRFSVAISVSTAPPLPKFLLLLVPKKNREHLLGDLEEEYRTVVLPEYGLRRAQWWYWEQVFISLWPFLWAILKRLAGMALFWKIVR
jgi:hypothetical protein